MAEIASEGDISKALLFHYFTNKKELYWCNMSALGFGRVPCFVGIALKILTKFVVRYKIN